MKITPNLKETLIEKISNEPFSDIARLLGYDGNEEKFNENCNIEEYIENYLDSCEESEMEELCETYELDFDEERDI